MTATHPPNISIPSSGQKSITRLSACKVHGPETSGQGHYSNLSDLLAQFEFDDNRNDLASVQNEANLKLVSISKIVDIL